MKSPIVISIEQRGPEPEVTLTGPEEIQTAVGIDKSRTLLGEVAGKTIWAAHAAELELTDGWVLRELGNPKLRCAMTLDRALEPFKHKKIELHPAAVSGNLERLRGTFAGTRAWDAAYEIDDEGFAWREAWRGGLKVDMFELTDLLAAKGRIVRNTSAMLGFDLRGNEHKKGEWLRGLGAFVEDTGEYGWARPSAVGTGCMTLHGLELFELYKLGYSAQSRYSILRGVQKSLVGGRVFPLVLLNSAATGRMSVKNPGIQSLPGDVRHIMRPSKTGEVFVSVDHSSAEIKVLARLIQVHLGDDTLALALRDGDPYQMLADHAGLARKDVKLRLLAHLYGQKEWTLKKIMGVAPATALLSSLKTLFPQIPAFKREIEERAKRGEPMTTLFGRNLRDLPGATYEDRPELAVNQLCQGSARDAWGVGVRRAVEVFGASALAIPVHDELIIQVPRADALSGIAADMLLEAMRIDLGGGVHLSGTAKIFSQGWGRP
jgi:hypothetical protein